MTLLMGSNYVVVKEAGATFDPFVFAGEPGSGGDAPGAHTRVGFTGLQAGRGVWCM